MAIKWLECLIAGVGSDGGEEDCVLRSKREECLGKLMALHTFFSLFWKGLHSLYLIDYAYRNGEQLVLIGSLRDYIKSQYFALI